MSDLVEIARIRGPHGLKGRLKITPYGDSFERFRKYTHLMIGRQGSPLRLVAAEQRKAFYIIELEGITHISQAESLAGQGLFIRKDQLEPLAEDEYYWRDLIGMQVMDQEGNALGEVVHIFSTGSNDVFEVDEQKRFLIPATKDVIREISMEKRCIIIDASLLEGLLE